MIEESYLAKRDKVITELLRICASDADEDIREAALDALVCINGEEVFGELLPLALNPPSKDLGARIITNCLRRDRDLAIAQISKLIEKDRRRILLIIGQIYERSSGAIENVTEYVLQWFHDKDPNPSVRRLAGRFLLLTEREKKLIWWVYFALWWIIPFIAIVLMTTGIAEGGFFFKLILLLSLIHVPIVLLIVLVPASIPVILLTSVLLYAIKLLRGRTALKCFLLSFPIIGLAYYGTTHYIARLEWPDPRNAILFACGQGSKSEICVIQADGTKQRQLTFDEIEDLKPTWSANRREIIFTSTTTDTLTLRLMRYYGSKLSWLEFCLSSRCDDAAWSPFPPRVALAHWDRETEDWDVYMYHGDTWYPICSTYEDDFAPSWSPDGRELAFVSVRDGGFQIYRCDVFSNETSQLTDTGDNSSPTWSPDGKFIAFHSNRDGYIRIYTMTSTGEEQMPITDFEGNSFCPSWSPDSQQVAFHSDKDGDYDIYVIDRDGTNLYKLTNNDVPNMYPAWAH